MNRIERWCYVYVNEDLFMPKPKNVISIKSKAAGARKRQRRVIK